MTVTVESPNIRNTILSIEKTTGNRNMNKRMKHNIAKLKLPPSRPIPFIKKPLSGTKVSEKLHCSGVDQMSVEFIRKNQISAIISLYEKEIPESICKEVGKEHHMHIKIPDKADVDIKQYFDEINNFINKNDVVLVHCQAGRSRSASCVIAYLMAEQGYSYDQAFEKLKRSRDVVSPNFSFITQLLDFEQELNSPERKSQFNFNLAKRKSESDEEEPHDRKKNRR
jgi:protein-tyrosine phosphatase